MAWTLALSPNRPRSEYDEALRCAREAIELAPNDAGIYITLALAEYRLGNWAGSLEACDRSIALGKGGTAHDWFFQAMARGRKVTRTSLASGLTRRSHGPSRRSPRTRSFSILGGKQPICWASRVRPHQARVRPRLPQPTNHTEREVQSTNDLS